MFFFDIRTTILDADPHDGGSPEESRKINSMAFQAVHHALAAYAGTLPHNKPALASYGTKGEQGLTCDVGISLPRSTHGQVGDVIRLHGSHGALNAVSSVLRDRIDGASVATTERTLDGIKHISVPLSEFVSLSAPKPVPATMRSAHVSRVRVKGSSAVRRMEKRYQARGEKMEHPPGVGRAAADRNQFPMFFVKSDRAAIQGSRPFPVIVKQDVFDKAAPERFCRSDFSTYGMALNPDVAIPFF